MEEKHYHIFKDSLDEHLVFSQNGYSKDKIYFKNLNLLILHTPERSYHFLVQGRLKYEFHEGEEFTQFLKANGVNWAEYHIKEIIDRSKGLYKTVSGKELDINPMWINTGYSYSIIDPDGKQNQLDFETGKVGLISIKEGDHNKKSVSVDFAYQGDKRDPEIQKYLRSVRSARRWDKVGGCITAIMIIVLFLLLGKIWTWIFGEPDDPFLNLLLPLY